MQSRLFWSAIHTLFGIFFLLMGATTAQAAISLTGVVQNDFPATTCIADPGGNDISWSPVSGFDVTRLCLYYDESQDVLYVGVETQDLATGANVIAGDADGDGDPGSSSMGQSDPANFGAKEFFALVWDFDHDVFNGFDAVVGVRPGETLSAFGIFAPTTAYLEDVVTDGFYGASLAGTTATLNHVPTSNAPHLEWRIQNFSQIVGFDELDVTDPNDQLALYFAMGNAAPSPIGEDVLPGTSGATIYFGMSSLSVNHLFQLDNDGDGLIDSVDSDDDDDGLSDLEEMGLSHYDKNGDGLLSLSQESNGNGIIDPGEEGEIRLSGLDANDNEVIEETELPGGVYPDFDNDGIPNYLDSDSDNDGLVDGVDPNPLNSDSDGDGLTDGDEVNIYKTNPREGDTDRGGVNDKDEIDAGTDPNNPNDDQASAAASTPASVASGDPDLAGYNVNDLQVQGSGLGNCSLNPTATLPASGVWLWMAGISGWLLWAARKRWIHPLCFLVILLAAPSSWAFNAQRLRPPTLLGGGGIFVPDAEMLGAMNFSAGAALNYANRPLQMGQKANAARVDNIVDHMLTNDLMVGVGVTQWLDVGLGVESTFFSDIEPIGVAGSQARADFGDMLLEGKIKWLNPALQRQGFGLAAMPFLTIPTGSSTYFSGDDNFTGGFKVVGHKWWGDQRLFANLGVRFREREDFLNLAIAHEFLYAVGASKVLWPEQDLSLIAELNGSTTFRKFMHESVSSPVEFDLAARKLFFGRTLGVTFGGGMGLNSGYGNPNVRLFTMAHYTPFSERDRDGDGIVDQRDRCPDEPEVYNGEGSYDGCPDEAVMESVAEAAPVVSAPKEVFIQNDHIVVMRPINFEYNSDKLLEESKGILDDVALLLERTPEIQKVMVSGHTDSDGSNSFNQRLSEGRSFQVKHYLEMKGVSASRLQSQGWGETKPLVKNDSKGNKAINRRVEFLILQMGPTTKTTTTTSDDVTPAPEQEEIDSAADSVP